MLNSESFALTTYRQLAGALVGAPAGASPPSGSKTSSITCTIASPACRSATFTGTLWPAMVSTQTLSLYFLT